jgi:hypothetical protein
MSTCGIPIVEERFVKLVIAHVKLKAWIVEGKMRQAHYAIISLQQT